MFAGRKLVIATKHHKEKVIAPILTKGLTVVCITDEKIDTDVLGTFTGEIERTDDVLETARNKCRMAMKITGCDMAIASEGSFGPHPTIGIINADDEMIMFIDLRNGLEIVVRELTIKTNFSGREINAEEELLTFAQQANFPSHGLILRKRYGDGSEIIKGISDQNILIETFKTYKQRYGSAYVETDMRALYNPTRMKVIKSCTQKLLTKIISTCPKCFTPGFGVNSVKTGLPCSLCNFPTRSVLSHEYVCVKCKFSEHKEYPLGQFEEEPTFCDRCNP